MTSFQRTFSDVLLFVIVLMLTSLIFTIYNNNRNVPIIPTLPVHTIPYDFKETFLVQKVSSNEGSKEVHFDLRIVVITYNRAYSLLRLLNTINDAEYYSDSIKLEVWVDISQDGQKDNLTIAAANEFQFKHGIYEVNVRQRHAGIYGQWLTSWKPSKNSTEICVILEDDLTVSRYFYKYLKAVHKKYDSYSDINGYSLQGFSLKHHISDRSTLEGPTGNLVFLYPVLGTWGFSPATDKWIKFLDWFYSLRNLTNVVPYIPYNIASEWYNTFLEQGKADSMWEIWHIYHAWLNNHYTVYSNFPGHEGLTSCYREAGLHYDSSAGASNLLLTKWEPEYDVLPDSLIYLDIAGKYVRNDSKVFLLKGTKR